jgi:S-formylglutathione hydrolase
MRKRLCIGWLDTTLLFLVGFAVLPPTGPLAQTLPAGQVIEETVHSSALERNLLGDSPDRNLTAYLPPSYARTSKRYPVVYLLNGFTDTNEEWLEKDWVNIPEVMDKLIAAGAIPQMIVAMPDTSNKLGGSFVTNSVATGNWEDFVVKDLVKFVDSKYRTVSQASGRGIAGHSSGGYGAIKLAMKHPDVFGAVYALSACCLEWDDGWSVTSSVWDKTLGFKNMNDFQSAQKLVEEGDPKDPSWLANFMSLGPVALSAAWSPDPAKPPFFGDWPVEVRGGTRVLIDRIRDAWVANLPLPMLGQYRSNLARLRGIAFEIGLQDWNQHLITQARDFDEALTRNGIRHQFVEFEGNHADKTRVRVETETLPFFSRVLE